MDDGPSSWPDFHEPGYRERIRSLTRPDVAEELAEPQRIEEDLRTGGYRDSASGEELDAVRRALRELRRELHERG